MRFTATVLCAQPNDRRDLTAFAGEPEANSFHQLAQPAGRERIAEKQGGIQVIRQRGTVDDLGEVSHELLIAGGPAEHVLAGSTGGENRWHWHDWVLP